MSLSMYTLGNYLKINEREGLEFLRVIFILLERQEYLPLEKSYMRLFN
jgi:hypothetical protein